MNLISIENALSPAYGLNPPLSETTATAPEPDSPACQAGFFRGVVLGLLIEAGGVALVYVAIHALRMAFR